jgi:ribosomal RNA-processing protein 7
MKKFNNFHVLSLSIPNHSPHYIYFKEHSTRVVNAELPQGKTLFVVNLPVDANLKTLKKLFKDYGTLERFIVKETSEFGFTPDKSILKSGTSGHLIFKEEDAIEHISSIDQLEYSPPKKLGINKWITEYLEMIPDSASLRKSIDQELIEYEEMEKMEKLKALEARNMPDKDGFVTVTRRGRRNTNKDGAGAIVSAIDPRELKNIKPKEQKLVDFYRFQKRQVKKNALQDLKEKFQQDKLKIQKLKENRKFKPY